MKFLVAYSGTSESKSALKLAKEHAKRWEAELVIVSSSEGGTGERLEEITRIQEELDAIKLDAEKEGLSCEVHQMARGLSPGEDLVQFADENAIDHIFVGIEKKSRTRKLLLGSTAQYIILKANCPITTIK